MPFQPFTTREFDGGVDETTHPVNIPDNCVSNLWNMEFSPTGKSVRTRRGTEELVKFTDGQISSCFGFKNTGATETKNLISGIFSGANKVYTVDSAGNLTDRGSKNLHYWTAMNDLAIGVGKYGTGVQPQKWNGVSATISDLGGSPPVSTCCEVWNSRLWLVSSVNRNRLYYSKVGDSEDHSATGISGAGFIEVGYNDGDDILGVKAHHEKLFIFKRRHIWVIITGNPNTDNTLWRLELFTKEGGTASGLSIQPFSNDLIFLSDSGVVSLNSLQQFGDFSRSVISRGLNIRTSQLDTIYPSVVIPDKTQYWCAADDFSTNAYVTSEDSNRATVYVLDKDERSGAIRWSKFRFYTGSTHAGNSWLPVGQQWIPVNALGTLNFSGVPHVMIGAGFNILNTSEVPVYIWPSRAVTEAEQYADAWKSGQATGKFLTQIQFKRWDFGMPSHRKLLRQFAIGIKRLAATGTITLHCAYEYDGNQGANGAVSIAFADTDSNIKDDVVWAPFGGFTDTDGRQCKEVSLTISNINAGQPFELKHVTVEAQPLDHKYVTLQSTIAGASQLTYPPAGVP